MIRSMPAFITASVFGASNYIPSAMALWPNPTSLTTGEQYLKLSPSFTIEFVSGNPPSDLFDAMSRTKAQIKNDKHQRLIVGRGDADAPHLEAANFLEKLTLQLDGEDEGHGVVKSIMENIIVDAEAKDESYRLQVPADGSSATLVANNTLGLFRGLTTFSQLFYLSGSTIYTYNTPLNIEDKAAFPHRGVLLDTARNYLPKADILRTLDAMSWTKFNVLHWHVVDSQSFPLEVAAFPEVSRAGAYDASSVYTVSDVKEIVNYAGARGIDVMMEIDTPGHTTVIAESHPEFVACVDKTPWIVYANQHPAGQLRLASKDVIKFTHDLFASVLENLPSKYFSSGGDEINTSCYRDDVVTQRQLKANGQTLEQALDTFTQETHAAITGVGKHPVVWEEMVLNHQVKLTNDTVAIVWVSSKNAAAIVKKGFRVIHAPSDYFYLDCGTGSYLGNSPSRNSWCDPYKTWQRMYSFDPFANLAEDQKHLVLGGQVALWAELSDATTLDQKLWPRSAAAAEVFWTGSNGPDGKPRNGGEALQRLHDLRYRFVQRGIQAVPLQPHWCALRPGTCDF